MKLGKILLVFLILSLPALAALDLNPPDWRGHDRSTSQFWDFSVNDLVPMPDGYTGPFQPLPAEVYPLSGSWHEIIGDHTGIFPLSGHIFVPIYNFSEPLDEKSIWIQFTWLSKGGSPAVEAKAGSQDILTQSMVQEWISGILIEEEPLNDGWMHSTYEVILSPNPDLEVIHIFGSIYIDDLVIDTLCLPEAASLSILAFGGGICILIGPPRRCYR